MFQKNERGRLTFETAPFIFIQYWKGQYIVVQQNVLTWVRSEAAPGKFNYIEKKVSLALIRFLKSQNST